MKRLTDKVVAATGHRPQKLGGYGTGSKYHETKEFQALVNLAREVFGEYRPKHVISGMALGWDQAVAQAAIDLKIEWTAAVPFKGFTAKWTTQSIVYANYLLSCATETVFVSEPPYTAMKLQLRNEWMVDHCEVLMALWDGTSGGTRNCLDYATRPIDAHGKPKKPTPVVNLWALYKKIRP